MKDEKIYITYEEIHHLVEDMANQISRDWTPELITAIGGGGVLPGRLFKTFLKKDFYVMGWSYYNENNERMEKPEVIQELRGLEEKIRGKKVLLVDEVDDSRVTLEFAVKYLLSFNPSEVRVAALYSKDKRKDGEIPEGVKMYIGKRVPDKWIDFPWEVKDIEEHYRLANETRL